MTSRNLSIQTDLLTRVEGHGRITVNVKDGVIQDCRLDIVEAPRFFEAMLKGRSIFEAQHITSRVCGICACGHTLASLAAAEDALGFTPSEQTMRFRELLMLFELLDSHILHIYLLAAPDMLGAKSFMQMLPEHATEVRRALRMKKGCNDMCDMLVGRHVHPITTVIGGFTKLPRQSELVKMRDILLSLKEDAEHMVALAEALPFPAFERQTEYVALVTDDDSYPLLTGDVGSTDGIRLPKERFREITNERVVPHSSAKHCSLSRSSYAVGALARWRVNGAMMHPAGKKVAERLNLTPHCGNPFMNTAAQVAESVHCIEESLHIVDSFLANGVDHTEEILVGMNEQKVIPVQAGTGVGAVEVPRGILFHEYTVNEAGIITGANCVIPTGQNLANMEDDMRALVPNMLDEPEERVKLKLEMLIRAYDPCISCSTHHLEVKIASV